VANHHPFAIDFKLVEQFRTSTLQSQPYVLPLWLADAKETTQSSKHHSLC